MGNEDSGLTARPTKVGGVSMTSEGNPVHQRKRGPGRCVMCGETWTDRYVGAEICSGKCYAARRRERERTQASEKKGE